MKIGSLLMVLALLSTGCTTVSLERNTLKQSESLSDLRCQEVMNNLALLAENPAYLPSYATISAGMTSLTDSGSATSTTTFGRLAAKPFTNYYTSEALDVMGSRKVSTNWTVDPVATPESLHAIRFACLWVLGGGKQTLPPEGLRLLSKFDQTKVLTQDEAIAVAGHYSNVETDMDKLPCNWLTKACLKEGQLK